MYYLYLVQFSNVNILLGFNEETLNLIDRIIVIINIGRKTALRQCIRLMAIITIYLVNYSCFKHYGFFYLTSIFDNLNIFFYLLDVRLINIRYIL